MPRRSWAAVQNQIQLVAASISLTLNSILIYLIITKSPKSLGPYKYLMIFISAFEMFYSAIDVLVSPFFHSHDSTFLLMVNLRTSMFSRPVTFALTSIYAGLFGSSLAIFGIHFIYRYLVSAGSKLLRFFFNWYLLLWLFPPLVMDSIWAYIATFLDENPAIREFIRSNIMENFELDVNDTLYIGPYFYQKQKNGSFIIDHDAIVSMTIIYSSIFASFSSIIFFGYKCYKNIKELAPTMNSFRSKVLQTQLFYALVSQTLIPVILLHIPVTLVYAFTFLDRDIGMFSGFVSITIALYPAIDPIPNILIIKPYRTAMRRLIWKVCCCCWKAPLPPSNTATIA